MKFWMSGALVAAALAAAHAVSAAGPVRLPPAAPPPARAPRASTVLRAMLATERAAAINRAAPVAPPPARSAAPAFPGPDYFVIPDELPATAENAHTYVDLAHRAMASCAAPQDAAADYNAARSALRAKQYRIAMADSRNIVDDCSAR